MNTLGSIFRVSVFGESHGPAIGAVVDGCPPGIEVDPQRIVAELDRRRGGRPGTTARVEPDVPEILSGVFAGRATGTPIVIALRNRNTRPSDYDALRDRPRPGHADFTGRIKSGGFADPRGGGHFSGRITAGLVAAGAIAKAVIAPATITARLLEAGGREDPAAAAEQAAADGDSIGGLIECRVGGLPAGIGEPFFDSLESQLAHGLFAIPGVKGVEFGAGFAVARMRGSELNDEIIDRRGRTATNRAGGINGGISNGNELVLRLAVRPAASISRPQRTVDLDSGERVELRVGGRHDPCIAIRVPPVVEAICAIAIADLALRAAALGPRDSVRKEAQG